MLPLRCVNIALHCLLVLWSLILHFVCLQGFYGRGTLAETAPAAS